MATIDLNHPLIGENLSFCIPFCKTLDERPYSQCDALNVIESYFNWGDTFAVASAETMANHGVVLIKLPRYSSKAQEIFCKIFLVLSYITAIVPLIMLIAKAIFRCGTQDYKIIGFLDPSPQSDQSRSRNDDERTSYRHNDQTTVQRLPSETNQGNLQIERNWQEMTIDNAEVIVSEQVRREVQGWIEVRSSSNPLTHCRRWEADKCWNYLKGIVAYAIEHPNYLEKRDIMSYFANQLVNSLCEYVVDRGPPGASVHPDERAQWTEELRIDSVINGQQANMTAAPVCRALATLDLPNLPILANRIFGTN